MTSDIDDLLEFLRAQERKATSVHGCSCKDCHLAGIKRFARWIAAVKGQRDAAILWASISATQREAIRQKAHDI